MQTPKASYLESRTVSFEVPESTSPMTPRTDPKLKITGSEFESTSSHQTSRDPKHRIPVTELQKKRPHISLRQLLELEKSSIECDQALRAEPEAVQMQDSVDSAALASVLDEIERLKIQLQMAAESETTHTKPAETTCVEIQSLKLNLAVTLALAKILDTRLKDCKESEGQSRALVKATPLQFQTVEGNAEKLWSVGLKRMEANNYLTSELEKSRMQVLSLEELVSKLQLDLVNASRDRSGDDEHTLETGEDGIVGEQEKLNMECNLMKLEEEQLKRTLDEEEHHESTMKTLDAYELVERIKIEPSMTVAELKESKNYIDELKATLMDKETELQRILKETECLNLKIVNNDQYSSEIQSKLEMELKKSKEDFADLKARLVDKQKELLRILEENQILKLEVMKKEMEKEKMNDDAIPDAEAARAEQEALKQLGYKKLEADESSMNAAGVVEQLEIAQASNSELEAELRRVKVQLDQWRKAAEAAAVVLYPITGEFSPLDFDMDDDSHKEKHGSMLKNIWVLWKKGQK